MGLREGFMFLVVLLISWTCADARSLVSYDIMDNDVARGENKMLEAVGRNEQLCTLCEEFTGQATDYLRDNKTETEIIDTLHQTCSQLQSFEQQCVLLVDFYAPLFFSEIAKIHPEEFCRKVNLCEDVVSVSLPKNGDTCSFCHQAVIEVLAKLKDPDSQLEIIHILLKECNKMEHHVQECKRLVFRYGPLILANGEKFLESTDVCTSIHVCRADQAAAVGVASLAE